MAQKNLFYIFDESDWDTRIHLAHAARDAGYDVRIGLICSAITPRDPCGFTVACLSAPARKFSPLATIGFIRKLGLAVKVHDPDIVHIVTLKYSFFLGLATLFSKVKKVYTLAGLGYVFRGEGVRPKILRMILGVPLRIVLRSKPAQSIFQNPDDREMMMRGGYVRAQNSHLIRGSGVALERFTSTPVPIEGTPIVLMPTRLVHNKGIHIFIEAAKIVTANGIDAQFQIAGGETKHNPAAISADEMHAMLNGSSVEWLGRVEDMPTRLQRSTLIVYPSYYGEGVPRVLLEAAASGRPIITTDHAGCREAIEDSKTGMLVPIKDVEATAFAISKLLTNPADMMEMGAKARVYAEAHYDVRDIAARSVEIYDAFKTQ